jgi:threonine aldolase
MGTLYQSGEIAGIARLAHGHGLKVHMDGARFANAAAALGGSPADITWRAGVDVLCFGGTKNGLPVGEAVVFFDRALSEDFAWRVKQAGQLASKMRFISAPWLGLLENDTWLANAGHANAMALRLHAAIHALPGVQVLHQPQANAVFAQLPSAAATALRAKGWRFYEFIAGGGCRFMCAWDTTPESVDAFAADIAAAVTQAASA